MHHVHDLSIGRLSSNCEEKLYLREMTSERTLKRLYRKIVVRTAFIQILQPGVDAALTGTRMHPATTVGLRYTFQISRTIRLQDTYLDTGQIMGACFSLQGGHKATYKPASEEVVCSSIFLLYHHASPFLLPPFVI